MPRVEHTRGPSTECFVGECSPLADGPQGTDALGRASARGTGLPCRGVRLPKDWSQRLLHTVPLWERALTGADVRTCFHRGGGGATTGPDATPPPSYLPKLGGEGGSWGGGGGIGGRAGGGGSPKGGCAPPTTTTCMVCHWAVQRDQKNTWYPLHRRMQKKNRYHWCRVPRTTISENLLGGGGRIQGPGLPPSPTCLLHTFAHFVSPSKPLGPTSPFFGGGFLPKPSPLSTTGARSGVWQPETPAPLRRALPTPGRVLHCLLRAAGVNMPGVAAVERGCTGACHGGGRAEDWGLEREGGQGGGQLRGDQICTDTHEHTYSCPGRGGGNYKRS